MLGIELGWLVVGGVEGEPCGCIDGMPDGKLIGRKVGETFG
jgi:hypothetical protein